MRPFEELFRESSAMHGHRCAGQVLGVRMAMAGCREVGIDEPKGCQKLVVYVEIDRCATDAVQAVTGCSLGKRTLKFLDYGKMAATFVNTATHRAVRVLAKEDARGYACVYAPDAANPGEAQKQAYAVMPEKLLFKIEPTKAEIAEEDLPGFRSPRVYCDACGEGISLRREVRRAEQTLCIPCAQPDPLRRQLGRTSSEALPPVLHIVGFKKVGKTTLIEKLVGELSARGLRVGTAKHHHSEFPVEVDKAGTDSWRHRRAGAQTVALMTPDQVTLFRDSSAGDSLERILPYFAGHDILIVEGLHQETGATIEVLSNGGRAPLCRGDKLLIATVGVHPAASEIPSFEPDAISPLADFIENTFLAAPGVRRSATLLADTRQIQSQPLAGRRVV